MSGLNKVMLIGRLGKDPEMKYTQSGTAVCSFSLATDEQWKDNSGEKQSKTTWHQIVAWKKLAEICGQYLQKGKQVYIEGKIQVREWDDKEGAKHKTTEIVASNMVMLGSSGDGEKNKARTTSTAPTSDVPDDDDIPF